MKALGNKLGKNVVGQGITWVFSAKVKMPLSAINFFCHKCSLCCLLFTSAALDFIMEANTMNHDQTAPLGAVRSGSILFAIQGSSETSF